MLVSVRAIGHVQPSKEYAWSTIYETKNIVGE
jgi:hypothetical protein